MIYACQASSADILSISHRSLSYRDINKGPRYVSARVWDDLSRVLVLVTLGNDGIDCDNSTELQCPECSDGEGCKYTVPLYYTQCATSASKRDVEVESHREGGGLTIGGIIGGVIGSIIITSVAIYLVWRFHVRPKRSHTLTRIFRACNPQPTRCI
ncbi:hypothetical protein DER46DRAFT_356280 [Fusarium sp. MPI-SDFR-AT-0072]|nr:hypothetical protein DER46DRAFT_356280 [Fusarium sp. MPI-SDFR-AT-0072]